jgi:diguanylate cyclase (GGDEF)-like protein
VRLQHLALHDTLTDLPNRIALDQTIEQAIAGGAVGAVVFLDIDHFKYVNDHVGHRAGDQLIKGVGSVLRETVRKSSAELYRIGGDEFAIHLPKSLREDAVEIADRALDAVRHYRYQAAGQNVVSNLSASAGIALYPFHGNDLGTLLANADIALYQAKDRGRNRHVLFDHNSDSLRSTHRRVHWSKKLRDALDDDRLLLFAQPVVRLSDQSTVHHEVLLRLRGEDGKVILPATFVDTAESLGIMQEFDMRVVEKLLVYMHQNNLGGKRLRFFVNLSRTSISDPHWVKRFVEMLSISKVDPSQLAFEITETAAMTEIGVTLNFIRQLKEMGSRFALDDFGAGFSSFYYLKRFDVDYLKIDGNFIQDLASDNSSQVFVRALNDVARGLNKQVIAEWVETPAVMKILQDMGTEYGQGYLFRQPFALDGPLAEPALAGAA